MDKSKIISIAVVLIILVTSFVVYFLSIKPAEEKGIYIERDKYPFVTDANGDPVLNSDGEFIVYATDKNGDIVTNANGEKETLNQLFEPYSANSYVEEYGYRFTFPEGWAVTSSNGRYINTKTDATLTVTAVNTPYQEFFVTQYETYLETQKLADQGVTVTWEDDLELLGDSVDGLVRFTFKHPDGMNVLYFFMNGGSLYKVLYEGKDASVALAESESLMKAIKFKGFDYFEPETDEQGSVVDDIIINSSDITTTVPTTTAPSLTEPAGD